MRMKKNTKSRVISSLLDLWIFCIFMQKIPMNGHTYAVCRVKNRLNGGFWRFYAQSATNC
jgi:hypothetical protein